MSEIIDTLEVTATKGSDIRAIFTKAWNLAGNIIESGDALELAIKPVKNTRSLAQNSLLWALLKDISEQVIWHGYRLTKEEWKCLLTASWKKQRSVPNIEGNGFVVVGVSTRKLSVKQKAELLEVITAFGNEQGVKFSAPKWMYEEAK